MSVVHTFLFEPARWTSRGHFYDEENRELQVSGETVITHDHHLWTNDGLMRLALAPEHPIKNRYHIVPFERGAHSTFWQSDNEAMGRMIGRFTIVGDALLSQFNSEDGRYSGQETLLQIDPMTYYGRGVLFDTEQRLSAWAVTLTWDNYQQPQR